MAVKSDPYGLYYSGMATDMPTIHIDQNGIRAELQLRGDGQRQPGRQLPDV